MDEPPLSQAINAIKIRKENQSPGNIASSHGFRWLQQPYSYKYRQLFPAAMSDNQEGLLLLMSSNLKENNNNKHGGNIESWPKWAVYQGLMEIMVWEITCGILLNPC